MEPSELLRFLVAALDETNGDEIDSGYSDRWAKSMGLAMFGETH